MHSILKPSNMPMDSIESFPPRSETTHDHEAQTRPDLGHNALVETITVSNTPSLLSNGSRTHSVTSVLSSASRRESGNTFLDATAVLLLNSPLGMNCYLATPQCLSPSPLGLVNSLEIHSQSIADPLWDDR